MTRHEHRYEKHEKLEGWFVCACGSHRKFKRAPQLEEPTVTAYHREYFDADADSLDDDRHIGEMFYEVEPERHHARRANERFALAMIFEL